jgi:hypothetical protein
MKQIFKKLFFTGLIGISIFEILKVFFIMPFPGSQEIKSIDIAYFLYTGRWYFRIAFGLMIIFGAINAFQTNKKWLPGVSLLIALIIIYLFNFPMMADSMFKQPEKLSFSKKADNKVKDNSLVICVINNGEVKAYPIQFMVYHHQVQDLVGGKPIIITYCSVCHTGRVFEPVIEGRKETFRLVGMDHYNAMFEDEETHSWWRQSTGEAITGPLKGKVLPETESVQFTIRKLLELYPEAYIMQADEASAAKYDTLARFEKGLSKNKLTMTDSLSWNKKSLVIGIKSGNESKVYDWNLLKNKHIINDKIGDQPIVLALSKDGQSFVAFKRPLETEFFSIRNDTLLSGNVAYNFAGNCITSPDERLKQIDAYQEFWHSWQAFHPDSKRYQ